MNLTWKDAGALARSNLTQTPLRTALTILGVVIGIGALSCMVAFGLGMQKISTEQLMRRNMLDTITIYPASAHFEDREADQDSREKKPPSPALDDSALADIAKIPGVSEVSGVVQFPCSVELPKGLHSSMVRSYHPERPRDRERYALEAGQHPTPDASAAIISVGLSRKLGYKKPQDAIGKTLKLVVNVPSLGGPGSGMVPSFGLSKNEIPLTIAGVVKGSGSEMDSAILESDTLVPLELIKTKNLQSIVSMASFFLHSGSTSTYSLLEVRTTDVRQVETVQGALTKKGYRSFSLVSILKEMNIVFLIFDSVLGAIGSIALVVAGLGIVNTMIIAVLERRKEIGIAKSVGATRRDIRRTFFVEAILIGSTGGLAGVGLGWAVSQVISFFVIQFLKSKGAPAVGLFHFPIWLVVASVGFATAVALASALYPATRAARMDPVESLRFE